MERNQEQDNAQGQLTRIEIPQPAATLDQLTEKLLELEDDERVAPIARALAGMCHILSDHVRVLYMRQGRIVGLCAMNAKTQKVLDGHLAEVIEAVRPLVASAQRPDQAQPGAPEAPPAEMSEEDEAAAMVEKAQKEAAEEMAKIQALALKKDAPVQAPLDGAVPSAPARKAGPVGRKAPPTGTNGGAP